MAFVSEVQKVDINEDDKIDISVLYCFLADKFDKIIHISENCVTDFNILPHIG